MKVDWEALDDGGAEAIVEGFNEFGYELEIEGRERPSMWNRSPSNTRTWSVGEYGGSTLASGQSEGLRNAKRDATNALAAHISSAAAAVQRPADNNT